MCITMETRHRSIERNINTSALIEKMMTDIDKLKDLKQRFDHYEGKNLIELHECRSVLVLWMQLISVFFCSIMLCSSTKVRCHERADCHSSWTITNHVQRVNFHAAIIDESPVKRIAIPLKHSREVEAVFLHWNSLKISHLGRQFAFNFFLQIKNNEFVWSILIVSFLIQTIKIVKNPFI